MITPGAHRIRLLRSAVPDAETLAQRVTDDDFTASAQALKSDERSSVFREGDIVVKSRVVAGLWPRIKLAAKRSPLHRHWRGFQRLRRADIDTAPCLALFTSRDDDGNAVETLVMEALDGFTLLHALDEARRKPGAWPVARRRALARAVGGQLRALLDARLFNRDHKPSNLIVRAQQPPRLAIIDCVAIRRTGGDPLERMLTALMLEPIGVGCPPRATDRMRVLVAATPRMTRENRKRVWRAVERRIAAHGDPTPRVNPLMHPSPARGRG